jgi:hypothetical protein
MKMLSRLFLCTALALAVHPGRAADDDERPPSVEARNWIAITDRLGFVVVNERKQFPGLGGQPGVLLVAPENVSAQHSPPRKGYFVVKTDSGWLRLTVSEPADLAG